VDEQDESDGDLIMPNQSKLVPNFQKTNDSIDVKSYLSRITVSHRKLHRQGTKILHN